MAEPKPPPGLPISTTITGSHLPVIPKKAAENEVKRVKGSRCSTPEMQRCRQPLGVPQAAPGSLCGSSCCDVDTVLRPNLLPQNLISSQ